MALTFFWRCEGTTLDGTHDYSAGATTGTANNAPSIDSSVYKVGSNSVLAAGSSDYYAFTPTNIWTGTAGSVGYWFRGTTIANDGRTLLVLRGAHFNDHIFIDTTGGGRPRLVIRNSANGTAVLALSTQTLSTGTWYFLTASWDVSATSRRIAVYDSSGTLLEASEDTSTDFTGNFPATITESVRIGANVGTFGNIDNVFIGSAYADYTAFVANRDITSYTSYDVGGSSAPTISSVSDTTLDNGQTGIVITGTNFGASQGGGSVIIVTEDDVQGLTFQTQTVTAWGDTEITITAARGSLPTATNLYLFVINDDAESNAAGYVVQFNSNLVLRVATSASAAGATGVAGVVFAEPTGGAITGAEIGEFTGAAFEESLESGRAVLYVPVGDFGGGSLTTSSTPVVLVRNTTHTTGIVPATVVEA